MFSCRRASMTGNTVNPLIRPVANLQLGERSEVWGGVPSGVQGRVPGRAKLKAVLFLDIPMEGPFFTSPQNFVGLT